MATSAISQPATGTISSEASHEESGDSHSFSESPRTSMDLATVDESSTSSPTSPLTSPKQPIRPPRSRKRSTSDALPLTDSGAEKKIGDDPSSLTSSVAVGATTPVKSSATAAATETATSTAPTTTPTHTHNKLATSPSASITKTPTPSKLSLELTFDGDEDEDANERERAATRTRKRSSLDSVTESSVLNDDNGGAVGGEPSGGTGTTTAAMPTGAISDSVRSNASPSTGTSVNAAAVAATAPEAQSTNGAQAPQQADRSASARPSSAQQGSHQTASNPASTTDDSSAASKQQQEETVGAPEGDGEEGTLGRIMRSASITATLDDQRRRKRAGSFLSIERPSEADEAKWEALIARVKKSQQQKHDDASGDDEEGRRKGSEGASDESNVTTELAHAVESLLGSVRSLAAENASLLAGRAELELNLKIARSNLQLAEMNSEMLEEALKRGGEGFAGRMLPPPTAGSVTVPASSRSATPVSASTTATSSSPRSSLTAVRESVAASASSSSAPASRSSLQQPRTPTAATITSGHAPKPSLPVISLSSSSPQQPKLGRRRSGSDGGSASISSATGAQAAGAIAIPGAGQRARPVMERSATLMPTTSSPSSASATSSGGGGIGSFFRNLTGDKPIRDVQASLGSLKMPDIPAGLRDLSAAIPSPSAETRKQFFDQFKFDYEDDPRLGMSHGGPLVASTPNLAQPSLGNIPGSSGIIRSRTPGPAAPPPPLAQPPTTASVEVGRLRQTLASAQVTVKDLTMELTEIRRAKKQLEEELESLSQELFEEANKMVADERKKAGMLEKEAQEARQERDVLRARLAGAQGPEGVAADEERAGLSNSPTIVEGRDGAKGSRDDIPASDSPPPPPKKEPDPAEIEALMRRMEEDFGKL